MTELLRDAPPTAPQTYFAVESTVFFQDTSCMIGINQIGVQDDFYFDAYGRLVASDGYAIEWPDVESESRVKEMYSRWPSRVFVCEFGPDGPVAEHSIVKEP